MPARQLLAKIHIAKKELGLDDETYRSMLEGITGKRSAAELSNQQIARVCREMARKGWTPRASRLTPDGKKYDDLGSRDPYAPSPRILRLIEVLWHEIYRGNDETKHLRQFLFNKFKASDVRFLDKRSAWQAVEALKAMKRRSHHGGTEGTEKPSFSSGEGTRGAPSPEEKGFMRGKEREPDFV